MNLFKTCAILAFVPTLTLVVAAADQFSGDAVPMETIVAQLESKGHAPIHEVSVDDGRWEAEVSLNGSAFELELDRKTGKILTSQPDFPSAQPPRDSLPLSEVLARLKKQGYSRFTKAEFESPNWKFLAELNEHRQKLWIDPANGQDLFRLDLGR